MIDGQPDLDLFDPLTEKFVVTLVKVTPTTTAAAAVPKTGQPSRQVAK
jgi:hypothetical protein